MNIYENENKEKAPCKISKERDIFAKVYKLISNFANLKANDILDFTNKLSLKDKSLSISQILFSLIVFMELNFFEFDETLNYMKVLKAKKMELSSSKFYNSVE